MKSIIIATVAGALALITATAQEIGKAAPAFSVKNTKGDLVSLADFKGKTVVLEWINFECPFVRVTIQDEKLTGFPAKAALMASSRFIPCLRIVEM